VDDLFVMESRNPQAFRVGTRTGHQWCHLWTEPGNPEALEALHRLAAKIGLRREWFQDRKGFPHYDLTPGKRALALKHGAVEQHLGDWLQQQRHGPHSARQCRECLGRGVYQVSGQRAPDMGLPYQYCACPFGVAARGEGRLQG
jgi:hypothetical protein